MLVIYWDKLLRGRYTIEARVDCGDFQFTGTLKSESQWIVPGTIDPRED